MNWPRLLGCAAYFMGGASVCLLAAFEEWCLFQPSPYLYPLSQFHQAVLLFCLLLIYPLLGSVIFYSAQSRVFQFPQPTLSKFRIFALSMCSFFAAYLSTKASPSFSSSTKGQPSDFYDALGILILFSSPYIIVRALTIRSTRTPPALPGALFLLLASSASLVASVQAGPVSFIR